MNMKELQSIFTIGETVAVEFKRCGNGIENDTYETVCSFLNRFGGELFMGVLDDGTVVGVPEKAAPDMVKNFIKVVSNPVLFSPTTYLIPEIIKYDENHTIIHVHIPPSAEVHSYKKVIYDRVDDADVKVTATGAIAQMYIRKQNIFTERKIYPYARMEDLRLDLLPKMYRRHKRIDLKQSRSKGTYAADSYCLHKTGQSKNGSCDCAACRSKYNGADCNRNYVKSYCQWSDIQISQWCISHQKKDSCHKAQNGQL